MNPIIGVEITKNDFQKKANAYPQQVSRIVRKTAYDILRISTPLTPKRTGMLRSNTGVLTGARLAGGIAGAGSDTVAVVYWAQFYAVYQEFGTRRITPRLFATQATAIAKPGFIAALKELEV